MHFAIPDTEERGTDPNKYTVYNLHVNGVFHCSTRYSELAEFNEKVRRDFASVPLPKFPPKKMFALNKEQLEERRAQLEEFFQRIGDMGQIVASDVLKQFLVDAQRNSEEMPSEDCEISLFLCDDTEVKVSAKSTDRTEYVMKLFAEKVGLARGNEINFALYLTEGPSEGGAIMRIVQPFESTHRALRRAKPGARLVVRRGSWNPTIELAMYSDDVAVNILYAQAIRDFNNGWLVPSSDMLEKLKALRKQGKKKEFLLLARELRDYGYIKLEPCMSDFPNKDSAVVVSVGPQDIRLRLQDENEEHSFKITRMRCWKLVGLNENVEFSFHYVFSKQDSQWVSIKGKQAIFASLCIQSIVDEIMRMREKEKAAAAASQSAAPQEAKPSAFGNAINSITQGIMNMSGGGTGRKNSVFEGGISDDDL
eukprot:Opistho-1_new@62184